MKAKKDEKIWEYAVSIIKSNITKKEFELWISPIKVEEIQPNAKKVLISVPTVYIKDHIQRYYEHLVQASLKTVLNWDNISIEYILSDNNSSLLGGEMIFKGNSGISQTHVIDFDRGEDARNLHPWMIPGLKKAFHNSNLHPDMTFSTFLVEESDKALSQVVKIAKVIAERPGNLSPCVLFYGQCGVGKTHIINAIGWMVLNLFPTLRVFYTSSQDLIKMIYDSFSEKKYTQLVDEILKIDVFLIDDIQFFEGLEASQSALFEIIEYYIKRREKNKQLLLVSDRHPDELKKINERIISRVKTGLLCEVPVPSIFTLKKILKNKLLLSGIDNISDADVDNIIAQLSANNPRFLPRDIEGFVINLAAHILTQVNREITPEIISEVINKVVPKVSRNNISLDWIVKEVIQHFGITESELKSDSRSSKIVLARHIISYLGREYTKFTTIEIGKIIGDKDHSSVIYGHATIKKRKSYDKALNQEIEEIVRKLGLKAVV